MSSVSPLALIERLLWIAVLVFVPFLALSAPCLLVLPALILLSRLLNFQRRPSDAFGSARFAEREDLESAGMLGGTRGLILGRELPLRPTFWSALKGIFVAPLADSADVCRRFRAALWRRPYDEGLLVRVPRFVHLMAVAPPGAGKGVGFVLPNLLSCSGSAVVLDPKGENHEATAFTRVERYGHRIVRLDPLGVCGDGGDRLNPLLSLDIDSPDALDRATALAEALVVTTGTENDPHWNEAAKLGILAAILYVCMYASQEDRTLNAVADLLTDPTAFEGMVVMMRDTQGVLADSHDHRPGYRLLQRLGNSMAAWKDRELSSVLSSIGRHLGWLHAANIEHHLGASTFDPRDLVRGDVTVYLCLPPRSLTTLSRLLRLWFTTLYGAVCECGPQEEKPVLFLLDEAASLGPMPSLFQAITLGRGYGVRVALILQNIGQLKVLFPKDGEHQTVDGAIDHKIVWGIRDHETAEKVSNYLGQETVTTVSHGTSRGGGSSGSLFDDKQPYSTSSNWGTSTTTSETGRKLLFADEILQLPPRLMVLLAKGVPPALIEQVRHYEDPEFARFQHDLGRPVSQVIQTIPQPPVFAPPEWPEVVPPEPVPPPTHQIVSCPTCSAKLRVKTTSAGKRATCPKCSEKFVIPAPVNQDAVENVAAV